MWAFKFTDAGNLSVYDHNGDHVAVVSNDGSGVSVPDDLLDVIGAELDARAWDLSDPWVREAMKTALLEAFERDDSL